MTAWLRGGGSVPLRTKLSALLMLLLLFGCASVGVSTTLVLRTYLYSHLDAQIELAGVRYANAIGQVDTDNDNDNPETTTIGQAVGTLGARIVGGKLVAIGVVSDEHEQVVITPADRDQIALLRPAKSPFDIELPMLGDYRLLVTSTSTGEVLVTGMPRDEVEQTLHRLWIADGVVFLMVLLGIGTLGTLAVRRSLMPLERVTTTALHISELPMATMAAGVTERVPEQDTRTEVGQVAAAVNHMLDRVDAALVQRQQSEDRLREFIADASHELRTPISVIRSHAELISQTGGDVAEPVRRSLDRIESETERMSALVEDLLLLARLDAGQQLAHEEVDLSLTAIDALSDAQVAGRDHVWTLDLPDEPVVVTGDRHRLHQVIANLLSNARIHTPPGTHVELAVLPTATGVDVVVSDDGPGMPPDLVSRAHERFVRADTARSRVHGSSGLGLAIVNGVVSAHNGTLSITSEPGQTKVVIHLPREADIVQPV